MIEKILNTTEDTLRKILENQYISIFVKILLICYSVYVAPQLSNNLLILFDNIFFKILIISLIFYIAQVDPITSILVAIAFILSLYTINNIKLYDLLNISKQTSDHNQNKDKVEIEEEIVEEEIKV